MPAIVADAAPLIMLARSALLDVARQVAGDLVVPRLVWAECTWDASRPGAGALIAAHKAEQIEVRDAQWSGSALPALDAGELAAIALALTLRCPVLMDERLGRRVATDRGLVVIGSAGLLLAAKGRGLVTAVRPILEAWAGWGYFLSADLKAAVIARACE